MHTVYKLFAELLLVEIDEVIDEVRMTVGRTNLIFKQEVVKKQLCRLPHC